MTHIVDFTAADFNEEYYTSRWSHGAASSQAAIEERWNLLSNFVDEICKGRDDSHGHAHMKAVAETTMLIIQEDFIDDTGNLTLDAITAAWLHDIADHKYDHDGTLEQRLDHFGHTNIWNYHEIKQVIKYVSFSTPQFPRNPRCILLPNPRHRQRRRQTRGNRLHRHPALYRIHYTHQPNLHPRTSHPRCQETCRRKTPPSRITIHQNTNSTHHRNPPP